MSHEFFQAMRQSIIDGATDHATELAHQALAAGVDPLQALQRGVVEGLDRAQLRPRVKIIVGGAPVTRKWAEEIGADGYGKDAVGAAALAKSLVEKSNGHAR